MDNAGHSRICFSSITTPALFFPFDRVVTLLVYQDLQTAHCNSVAEWVRRMAAQPFFTISVLAVFDDLLHLVEILCADDSLMRVGDVVGRDGSFVLDLLFRNEVRRVDRSGDEGRLCISRSSTFA